MVPEQVVREKFLKLSPVLSEQQKRLWAAAEALSLGYGGVTIVQQATKLSRTTIHIGIHELEKGFTPEEMERIRHKGGGRNTVEEEYPLLQQNLKELLEDCTIGDPMQPLLWTSKSTSHLAEELKARGYNISDKTVARILHDLGYSLQANRKTFDATGQHPNRDRQFHHINVMTKEFQAKEQPVISVDAKKKELVGNFKNAGQEWRPQGEPHYVNGHDFAEDKQRNKAIPYGIYDITWNAGWVSVGIDHDTAEFAVESIRRWWKKMGSETYPAAQKLLIIADSGGSNSSRVRLWKTELQEFANETGLKISVCHLPPGTSKWNRIEHRLFCHITKNWQARPLINYEVVVNLISHTKTKQGLKVQSELDTNAYPLGKKVSKEELGAVKLEFHEPDEKWNYTISPAV